MTPVVNGLKDEFEGKAEIVFLDAAGMENVQIQQKYGVRGHPSFVILNENGEVVQTFIGPQEADTLRVALNKALP